MLEKSKNQFEILALVWPAQQVCKLKAKNKLELSLYRLKS